MHNELTFLRAIIENPDDIGLRLVCADWYEERGDARGDFIRAQCSLVDLPDSDPRRAGLVRCASDLLVQHRRRWNGSLHRQLGATPLRGQVRARRSMIKGWSYQRGFVESLTIRTDALTAFSDIAFQLGPLRRLILWGPGSGVRGLANLARLRQLHSLEVSVRDFSDAEVWHLLSSPHLPMRSRITLREVAGPVLEALQRSRSLAHLVFDQCTVR